LALLLLSAWATAYGQHVNQIAAPMSEARIAERTRDRARELHE
jgi:hypothetical protein